MKPTGTSFERCAQACAMHAAGRIVDAERVYREVLRDDPACSDALQGLGVLCLQTQRAEPAIKYLSGAVATGAGSATLYNNLGVALTAVRHFDEAAAAYRHALVLEPVAAETHANLAAVLFAAGQIDDAIAHFRTAAQLNPEDAGRAMRLATTALRVGRFDTAVAAFAAALALQPNLAEAHCGLGEALGALDRHEEAVIAFERAIALAPDVAVIRYNYGSALTFVGRLDEARSAYEAAIARAPGVPSYRYAALALKDVTADDADLKALEAMAGMATRYPAWEQAELHVAIAQAYDGLGRYREAFQHLTAGNVIKRGLVHYDEAGELERLRRTAGVFTPEFLHSQYGEGNGDPRPVFVVGMPRSGTSLVEQILASHPAVFGAGEQLILSELAGSDFPASAVDGRAIGTAYIARLQAVAPQAARIVDKMPGNFIYAGLISSILPKARIIHVIRDPLDTCLSCYGKLFSGSVNSAYDLGELGRYYRGYEALMAHWHRVLPQTVLVDVAYEDLVGDLETQARRLVAHCGLEWDARCLDFHKTARVVRTASAIQVRRPLYRSAVGRARFYLPWLRPLTDALAGAS